MSEPNFQLILMNKLTELSVGQAEIATDMSAVKEHLAKLNGRVADHERRLGEMLIEVAERRHQCPLVDSLESRTRLVEAHVISEAAESKTSATWLRMVWPIIWAVAGALVIIILTNASSLLKMHP